MAVLLTVELLRLGENLLLIKSKIMTDSAKDKLIQYLLQLNHCLGVRLLKSRGIILNLSNRLLLLLL